MFSRFDTSDAYYIKDEIINAVATGLANDGSIKIIYEENFKTICKMIGNLTKHIANVCEDMDDWEDKKINTISQFEFDISRLFE